LQKDIILNLLKEADELLKKGDLVQASEKYYKAAEEAIKILAIKKSLSIIDIVNKRKRWSSELLFKAAKMLGILDIWKAAWTLHQDGFHEMILSSELVEFYSKKVKEVVNLLKD